jgi:hypothetical protein
MHQSEASGKSMDSYSFLEIPGEGVPGGCYTVARKKFEANWSKQLGNRAFAPAQLA